MDSKTYDIVVFGATGFTGGLTADYLAAAAKREKFTWAIAGRSLKKLNAVKKRLQREAGSSEPPAVIKADIEQPATLLKMARQARVVITTVGPYVHYGEPVVRACVEAGAHYVDLTGEPEFVDFVRYKYHEEAQSKGLRIVNCCGFDSIPHDLGALFAVTELARRIDNDIRGEAVRVEGFVTAGGEFSGGTWHSAINAFARWRRYQRERKFWVREGRGEHRASNRVVKAVPMDLRYRRELKAWALPFPTIDPQVVRRSAKAIAEYGARFEYGHYVLVRRLPKAVASAVAVGGLFALAQLKPTRNLLLKLKDQGEGPSEAAREQGWFRVVMQARSSQMALTAQVTGGDPGYTETAKMLAESALCLALDANKLPQFSGVITPAMAMGQPLVERLQSAGIRFEVVE